MKVQETLAEQVSKNYDTFLKAPMHEKLGVVTETVAGLNSQFNSIPSRGTTGYTFKANWLYDVTCHLADRYSNKKWSLMKQLASHETLPPHYNFAYKFFPFIGDTLSPDNTDEDILTTDSPATVAILNEEVLKQLDPNKIYIIHIKRGITWLYSNTNSSFVEESRLKARVVLDSKFSVPEWLYLLWNYFDIESIALPVDDKIFYTCPFNSKYTSKLLLSNTNKGKRNIAKRSLAEIMDSNNLQPYKLKRNGNFLLEDILYSDISNNALYISKGTHHINKTNLLADRKAPININTLVIHSHLNFLKFGIPCNIKTLIYNPIEESNDTQWEDEPSPEEVLSLINNCHIDTAIINKEPYETIFNHCDINKVIFLTNCKRTKYGFYNTSIGEVLTHKSLLADKDFQYCTILSQRLATAEELREATSQCVFYSQPDTEQAMNKNYRYIYKESN